MVVKPDKFVIVDSFSEKLNPKKTVLYLVLFALSLLVVFRVIPPLFGLVVISLPLFFADWEAFYMVDYPLLGTFFFFFIFAGNLSRIDSVNALISGWMEKDSLLVSVLSCQCISTVPSAILLSKFTTDYESLLMGVNIGGTGTLISSLASLITFSEFKILYPNQCKKYLLIFSTLNIIFLGVMTIACKFFFIR